MKDTKSPQINHYKEIKPIGNGNYGILTRQSLSRRKYHHLQKIRQQKNPNWPARRKRKTGSSPRSQSPKKPQTCPYC